MKMNIRDKTVPVIFGFLLVVMALGEWLLNHSGWAGLCGALKDIFASGMVFFTYFVAVAELRKNRRKDKDKLCYFDDFENNKHEFLDKKDTRYFRKNYKAIFYGMQVSAYSGDRLKLLDLAQKVKDQKGNDECDAVAGCIVDVISVFDAMSVQNIQTKRTKLERLEEELNSDIEMLTERIKDTNLLAWCIFQRSDKLELVYEELAAISESEEAERNYIDLALAHCDKNLELLDVCEKENRHDKNYSLLYRAFINRNKYLLLKKLGETAKAFSLLEESLNDREKLFRHYEERNSCETVKEIVTHEYLLALVESYGAESERSKKEKLYQIAQEFYLPWENMIKLQEELFKKVKAEMERIEEERKGNDEKNSAFM